MGILDLLFERRTDESREERSLSLTDHEQWVNLGLVSTTASGVSVTPENSMRHSAVFACVRILSETLASLPLLIYERRDRVKTRAVNHHLYPILHERPNPFMTAFELSETLQAHLALRGNAYSQIEYDGAGRVSEIWPLRPDMMLDTVIKDGQRIYQYMLPNGNVEWLPGSMIWHLRGLGSDGLNGYSPIGLMRQAVGLGMAAEEFGARLFGNDARPGGVLEHPGTLSEKAYANLQKHWETRHRGLSKSHRIGILEEGMKFEQIGIAPEEAQFLETRKFQVQEIARMFRVPPHMLADLERATFSNIEHQSIDFVVHTMRPWLVRWEQSIKQNLMLARDRERFYPEFLIEGLLRGDTQSRYEAYSVGRQNGWLSANDIRELENMNPIDGGDIYLIPLNMVPADSAGNFRTIPADQLGDFVVLPPPALPDSQTFENGNNGHPHRRNLTPAQLRSVTSRRRIQLSHQQMFEDGFARVYRREINDVGAAAKRLLGQRDALEFGEWLREFYQEHRGFIVRQVLPVFSAFSELIGFEAGDEVNSEPHPQAMENFSRKYAESFAERQAAYSETRMREAVQAEDPIAEIEAEFDNWREVRPGREATGETVQLNAAVSKMVWIAAGRSALTWVTFGEDCPYCQSLDGKTVGINSWFLEANFNFQPEGAEKPLKSSVNVGHPPVHGGCDCGIVAA